MSSPRIISFRIAPQRVAELDAIAKSLDRDRSHLLNEAVESYLDQQRRFVVMVKEGLRASKNGKTIDDEDLDHLIGSWVKPKPVGKKEQKARRDK
ncbi:MAG: ribbon-helix-helix domain-containing protein [Terracidiphilus sp.]|nr:ribbon-helix-helix domain-containing protein [Terracidiphilus sp.]